MKREYHRWFSDRLHRDMELLVFGHGGAKVILFPTREGRFYEYENLGVVNALRHKIEAGHLQVFCVEGLADESFYCWWREPSERIRRYLQYEDYILNEVLPFMALINPHSCTISAGCSLGAFYAVNLAFRHPRLFSKVAGFSGRYDLTLNVEHFGDLFDGYYDDQIYFNTPCHFLPGLNDEWRLQALRAMDVVLVIGRDDPFLPNNLDLGRILSDKGIHHSLHVWDGRAHRGYYWRKMAPLYI